MEKLETETKKNPGGTGSDERAVVTLIRPELAKKEPQRTMPKWETETRESGDGLSLQRSFSVDLSGYLVKGRRKKRVRAA